MAEVFCGYKVYGSEFKSNKGAVAVCYRSLIMRHLLLNSDQRLKKLNDISAFVGLISMAGLAGVGAFPVSTVFWAHMLAAGVHFVFAMIYIIVQTFLNHYVPGANVLLNRLRILFCVGVLCLLFLLVIFFPLSHFKWHKVNPGPPALKTPQDENGGFQPVVRVPQGVREGPFGGTRIQSC
ncbi:hypothetical protein AVEN_21000-1 [Araneus ventricosus]|uniref:CWH43-like N-terminal domain-containing protein n=1 Tax=Araneus ventricosus TaxID=182803 RepID=A0A4Y2D7F8_ARAVE|nr:hypothetical protein AVEN_21000-1 [Araneus ventricosus]